MQINDANRTSIPLKVLVPTMIILDMLIIAAGTATYLVPVGTFKEVTRDRSTINEYQRLEQTPVPVWKIALAPLSKNYPLADRIEGPRNSPAAEAGTIFWPNI